jgi:uncharacterized protein (AIM24 family)
MATPLTFITTLEFTATRRYIIQNSAYIASTDDVDSDVKWKGFAKGLLGQGLFMLKATGKGLRFINTFGAINKHTLKPR